MNSLTLTPYCPKRLLRSAGLGLLAVPESRLRSKEDCAFAVLSLPVRLPVSIRSADTVYALKSCLKTHFYRLAFWPDKFI